MISFKFFTTCVVVAFLAVFAYELVAWAFTIIEMVPR